MDKLHTGQFWCWQHLSGSLIRSSFKEPAEFAKKYAYGRDSFSSEHPHVFERKHGVVPARGELLLLDTTEWVRDCKEYKGTPQKTRAFCDLVGCDIDCKLQLHARVLVRKKLDT